MDNNVAVCVSGLATTSHISPEKLKANIERTRKILDFPFFYAQWKGREQDIGYDCLLLDEPTPHYHCIEDTTLDHDCPTFSNYKSSKIYSKPGAYEKTKHWTKQILGHTRLVATIPKQYTTIIRLRYDTYINSSVNWTALIKEVQRTGNPVGGSAPRYENAIQDLDFNHMPVQLHKPLDCRFCKQKYMWDHVQIHQRHSLDKVEALYREKKLLPSEWGWYQVLSTPQFTNYENLGVLIRKLKQCI